MNIRKLKNMSKLTTLNEENLFEFDFSENKTENEQLPITLFEEIESELCDFVFHWSSPEDETDGAIDTIRNIVDNIKSEIENLVENNDQKKFLNILSKTFTILLSVKVGNNDKIITIVKLIVSTVLKKWSELN